MSAIVSIMTWHQTLDMQLSELMMCDTVMGHFVTQLRVIRPDSCISLVCIPFTNTVNEVTVSFWIWNMYVLSVSGLYHCIINNIVPLSFVRHMGGSGLFYRSLLAPPPGLAAAPQHPPPRRPPDPLHRPRHGSQHPSPRHPPPPRPAPPPQPPAPAPTAPHATPSTAPSAAPSPHFPRHPTPHPPPRPAQPPRLVSRFPHRKNSGGQIKKNGTRVQWLRSPWEEGPPPRRPRGSHRNEMAHCNVTDSP